MMQYKTYRAAVEFDDSVGAFVGRVLNTKDVLTFEGASVKELKQALRDTVEEYLAWCRERGEEPERGYSGQFRLRLRPDLHRQVAVTAESRGKSLNAFIAETLEDAVQEGD